MRLLCWNVAGRVRRITAQVDAVWEACPDVVALQEVTLNTSVVWRRELAVELAHVVYSADAGGRRHGVLVASRWPLELSARPPAVPWPESIAAVRLAAPAGSVELHAVHVPNSQHGWLKVETLEALLCRWVDLRRIDPPVRLVVCGDFNAPRRELADGTVVTFARDHYGNLRAERGERWDFAERAPFVEARELGIFDCFRARHGFDRGELSWTWSRWPASGYRLDHVLASAEITAKTCDYRHEPRLRGLSDHSAIEAELEIT